MYPALRSLGLCLMLAANCGTEDAVVEVATLPLDAPHTGASVDPIAHFPIEFPASCNDENAVGWISDRAGGSDGVWSPTGTGAIGCVLIQGPGARSFLRFDGGWVEVPAIAPLRFTDGLTISALVRTHDAALRQKIAVFGVARSSFGMWIDAGAYVFAVVREDGGPHASFTRGPAVNGTWARVTGTYDGERVALWIDGTQVDEVVGRGTIVPPIGALLFGGMPDGARLHGGLDDIRIYDRALTADEIAALPRS